MYGISDQLEQIRVLNGPPSAIDREHYNRIRQYQLPFHDLRKSPSNIVLHIPDHIVSVNHSFLWGHIILDYFPLEKTFSTFLVAGPTISRFYTPLNVPHEITRNLADGHRPSDNPYCQQGPTSSIRNGKRGNDPALGDRASRKGWWTQPQKRPTVFPVSSMSTCSAAGILGRPGISIMSPQMATRKPAPAFT